MTKKQLQKAISGYCQSIVSTIRFYDSQGLPKIHIGRVLTTLGAEWMVKAECEQALGVCSSARDLFKEVKKAQAETNYYTNQRKTQAEKWGWTEAENKLYGSTRTEAGTSYHTNQRKGKKKG